MLTIPHFNVYHGSRLVRTTNDRQEAFRFATIAANADPQHRSAVVVEVTS